MPSASQRHRHAPAQQRIEGSGKTLKLRPSDCPGLKVFQQPLINTPALRALLQAVEQSGITKKPLQKSEQAGNYKLDRLFHDCPAWDILWCFRLNDPCVRLDQFLAEQGDKFSLGEPIELLRLIAQAVSYAHRQAQSH